MVLELIYRLSQGSNCSWSLWTPKGATANSAHLRNDPPNTSALMAAPKQIQGRKRGESKKKKQHDVLNKITFDFAMILLAFFKLLILHLMV